MHFLVLVTGCNSVGKMGSSEIYRVTSVQMVSLRGFAPDEERVTEIKKLLCCGTFYFSWSASTASEEDRVFDLTLAAQKTHQKRDSPETDNRFFWYGSFFPFDHLSSWYTTCYAPHLNRNRMFFIPFIRYGVDADSWLLKVMCGSVEIRTVYVGSRQAKAAVISRLSSERAGTR